MSLASIETIMDRIAGATPDSQIAVFKDSALMAGFLDARFAACVQTIERVNAGDPRHVGNFDRTMDRKFVRAQLSRATRSQ